MLPNENKIVPWKGVDVLLFLVLFWGRTLWCIFIGYIAFFYFPQSSGHTLTQLAATGKNDPIVFLIAILFLVVATPIIEEFVFRLLLQDWLEAKFRQYRIPLASSVAIVIASLVFAFSHVGNYTAYFGIYTNAVFLAVSHIVLSLLLFTFGIVYLIRKRNVKITQYLFGAERFFRRRFFRNAGYCLLALLGYIILSGNMTHRMGIEFIPAHVFFFSLIVGVVYSRTHNLSYCIFLHALCNAIIFMFYLL